MRTRENTDLIAIRAYYVIVAGLLTFALVRAIIFTFSNHHKPVLSTGMASTYAVRKSPIDGAEMVFIPAGEFILDNDFGTLHDDPYGRGNHRQKIKLSGYWIYKDLVTVGQYKAYCKANSLEMPPDPRVGVLCSGCTVYYQTVNNQLSPSIYESFNPGWIDNEQPMVRVTWDQASAYAQWAHATLPTAAQWEKAARGTHGSNYPWGNEFGNDPFASKKAEYTSAFSIRSDRGYYTVEESHAEKAAGRTSPYGCRDMIGIVGQWCMDWYDPDYWSISHGPDPVNTKAGEPPSQYTPDTKSRVYVGSTDLNPNYQDIMWRLDARLPCDWSNHIGFRCVVRDVTESKNSARH